jgi:hypothetical protein
MQDKRFKIKRGARDGILGHQFNKRLESFASCYSESLLLADFKETILFPGFNNHYTKKSGKKRKSESIHEYHFVEGKK